MMSRPRTAAAIAAVGLAATFSIAAHVPDGCYVALEGDPTLEDDDVIACEEQHWFHTAETPANTIGNVDTTGTHGTATFDTTPPAGSVTDGNGGGYAGWSTLLVGGDDGLTDAGFTGQFTGVVDAMDFDVHLLVDTKLTPDSTQVLTYNNNYPIDLDITIDGIPVHSTGEDPVRVHFEPEANSNAGAYRLDFTVTGIAALLEQYSSFIDNDPDTVHDIQVRIGSGFLDVAWIMAFDTTEVPGGITFNPVVVPTESTIIPVS